MNKIEKIKAEIERRIKAYNYPSKFDRDYKLMITALEELLPFIESLEKEQELDLEKEIEEHAINMPMSEFTHDSEAEDFFEWAKGEFRYFFELGLKAQKGE